MLHAGSGTGSGQPETPESLKVRQDFSVAFGVDPDMVGEDGELTITTRVGGIRFAKIDLHELSVRPVSAHAVFIHETV